MQTKANEAAAAGSAHLLVLRFSSMGDVAMTVPVVKQLLEQHPHLTLTFVSDKKFAALFEGIPRLTFFGADLKHRHKGFAGLLKLFLSLKKIHQVTAIADLHNVLRTQVLGGLFGALGKPVSRINKGRPEKKALTRQHNKRLVQLPSTFHRYANVFKQLGYPVLLTTPAERTHLPLAASVQALLGSTGAATIGVAPFARYAEKTYPLPAMQQVVTALAHSGHTLFLFGSATEAGELEKWCAGMPNVVNVAGSLSFGEELALISHLHVMISMDSANMHFASLYGVPVVSIWGATHRFAGFYGYGQYPENAVEGHIYCRPCSVFGNKPCFRGDIACLHQVAPAEVIAKVEKVLQQFR